MPLDNRLNAWVSDIGFQPPMVRGLISNIKTNTRRQTHTKKGGKSKWLNMAERFEANKSTPNYHEYLYVREGIAATPKYNAILNEMKLTFRIDYISSSYKHIHSGRTLYDSNLFDVHPDDGKSIHKLKSKKTFPSIHMPRWASRLVLEVTNVRIEPVQAISQEDAIAEGVDCIGCGGINEERNGVHAIKAFKHLWESLHGKTEGYRWADNPDVVVINFKVHHGNINTFKITG